MTRTVRLGAGGWIIAVFLLGPALTAGAPAAQDAPSYVRSVEEFVFEPGSPGMITTTYEPRSDYPQGRLPLILALHFGGRVTPTTGRDFAETLILPALKELGAVILAPNCPGRGWTDPISEEAVLKLIASARKRFLIDKRRIAVTGFSMGAIGTYRLAARHPELFTAAIPVSGIPDPEDIETMGRIPLYIIQSDGDEIFPIDDARRAFEILRQKNPATRIEIVGGLSHYQTDAYVPALKKAAAWLRKVWRNT